MDCCVASCVALSEAMLSSSSIAVPLTPVFKTAEVNVLLVNVSVVALPTNVSVLVGKVKVPVLLMLEMIGVVSVLFVSVSVPASVANEPSLNAVLNSAVVPLNVLFVKLIDLLVNVCVAASVTSGPVTPSNKLSSATVDVSAVVPSFNVP